MSIAFNPTFSFQPLFVETIEIYMFISGENK